mmetsp:Transcript_53141/g.154652  ORF Transcript_53141/g.154652 Transcript_53141/m.154652 type:complete len:263 (+) Transcript_53141:661-1449(+)
MGLLLLVPEVPLLAILRDPDEATRVRGKDRGRGHSSLIPQQVHDANVGRASPMKEEPLLPQPAPELRAGRVPQPQRPEQRGHGHRGGALNVVIVGQVLLTILGQQRKCIIGVEILKLQQAGPAKEISGSLHELFDHVILAIVGCVHHRSCIRLVRDASLLQARVQLMIPNLEPVSVALRAVAPSIDDYRDRPVGINASADSVQVQFPDGNAHAPGPEVAEAEDAAAVGEDHAVAEEAAGGVPRELGLRVLLQDLLQLSPIGD